MTIMTGITANKHHRRKLGWDEVILFKFMI